MPRKSKFLIFVSLAAFTAVPILAGATSKDTGSSADAGTSVREQVLSNPDSVDIGKHKFAAICSYCHGAGGSGGKARPLKGQHFTADYIFTTITNGRTDGANVMPSWSRLPEKLRWQLVSYILSLQAKPGKSN